jgi:hypothetical protein
MEIWVKICEEKYIIFNIFLRNNNKFIKFLSINISSAIKNKKKKKKYFLTIDIILISKNRLNVFITVEYRKYRCDEKKDYVK